MPFFAFDFISTFLYIFDNFYSVVSGLAIVISEKFKLAREVNMKLENTVYNLTYGEHMPLSHNFRSIHVLRSFLIQRYSFSFFFFAYSLSFNITFCSIYRTGINKFYNHANQKYLMVAYNKFKINKE